MRRVEVTLALEEPESIGRVEIRNWFVLFVLGVPVEFNLNKSSARAYQTAE
jgi:hypothetical protein